MIVASCDSHHFFLFSTFFRFILIGPKERKERPSNVKENGTEEKEDKGILKKMSQTRDRDRETE